MNVVAETRDGATALSKWTRDRFGEDLAVYWRWLVLYAFLLITGVLGELVSCAWAPSSVFWAQVLPQLHYLGVVLAALLFGVSGGLAAACLVGVAQITVISTACHQTTAYSGNLAMFAALGLLAGWIGNRRVPASAPANRPQTRRVEEHHRDVSITDLGQLIPELVHQFRTPMASIAGAGFVLEDADLSHDKRLELVAIIRKECWRLELLIELLDFTHPGSLQYEEADIRRLLDEVIEQIRPSAGLCIRLQNVAPRDLPRLRCVPDLVKYGLQIITTDAVRSIPEYGDVELSAALVPEGMAIRVHIHSENNDPPLETALNHDRARSDLAVVRQIANQHGGSVQVEQGIDGAVTISMILPARRL